MDAERLPYADGSLANLVLIDVFHHLADPAGFLDEARRTLAPGGRVVILDPYCSPVSTLAYRAFHPERTDLSAPAFAPEAEIAADPLASNQARATLVFFRHAELRRGWPDLRVVERRRLALVAYPLSGGFFGRLAPGAAYRPLAAAERVLAPLAPLLAFRASSSSSAPSGRSRRGTSRRRTPSSGSRSPWRKRLMFVSYVRAW